MILVSYSFIKYLTNNAALSLMLLNSRKLINYLKLSLSVILGKTLIFTHLLFYMSSELKVSEINVRALLGGTIGWMVDVFDLTLILFIASIIGEPSS